MPATGCGYSGDTLPPAFYTCDRWSILTYSNFNKNKLKVFGVVYDLHALFVIFFFFPFKLSNIFFNKAIWTFITHVSNSWAPTFLLFLRGQKPTRFKTGAKTNKIIRSGVKK